MLTTTLPCEDKTIELALEIVKCSLQHGKYVIKRLLPPAPKFNTKAMPDNNELLYEALPDTFKTAQVTTVALELGIAPRFCKRWLAGWGEKGLVYRLQHGHYKKTTPKPNEPNEPKVPSQNNENHET